MAAYTRGTIHPARNFDPATLSQALHKAMKGLGTNEKAIVEIIGGVSNGQRQQLKQTFLGMYGKDLCDKLKGELSGRFEDVVLGLMQPPAEYLADWLHKAMKGLGTDEYAVIEVLCGRTNNQIREIRGAYQAKYGKDLEEALTSELSGDFCHLIRSILAAARDESPHVDLNQADIDAAELYKAGVGSVGTDESKFITILNMRSYAHLREVFQIYGRNAQKPIEDAIKSECSGYFCDGLLAIVSMVKDAPAFFAERLNKKMKGLGTDDGALIRIVISRSEIDLEDIKARYLEMYGVTLGDAIANETSGDYEKILLRIVDAA